MPNRPWELPAELLPVLEPDVSRYESDLYSWAQQQARRVREGRWAEVDRENVAEEIEALGREQFNKLESALRVLLLHMLKWDHQPARRSRSWRLSIKAQRLELRDVLADSPGLKPRLGEALARAYERAVIEAARETGLEEDRFPHACPYGWDDLTKRDFSA